MLSELSKFPIIIYLSLPFAINDPEISVQTFLSLKSLVDGLKITGTKGKGEEGNIKVSISVSEKYTPILLETKLQLSPGLT